MIEQLDHVERVRSRIYLQYRDKEKLTNWLLINANIANIFEGMFTELYCLYDIDTNSGAQLDLIGRVIGQERILINDVPATDTQYRIFLKARIAKNVSNCSFDSIIDLMEFVTGLDINRIVDNEDMSFNIEFDEAVPSDIQDILNDFDIVPRPQGVNFGGFNVDVGTPLTVTIPVNVSASCNFQSPQTGCSNNTSITSTPGGGQAPYTYTWEKLSGVGTMVPPSNTEQTVNLIAGPGEAGVGTYRVTVSDSIGNTQASNVCTATFAENETFDPLTVTVNGPTNLSCQFDPDDESGCVNSGTLTSSVGGGDQSSLTYAWSVISGVGEIVGSSTGSSVNIRSLAGTTGGSNATTYRLTVTDGQGTQQSDDHIVTFEEDQEPLAFNLGGGTNTIAAVDLAANSTVRARYGLRRNGTSFRQAITTSAGTGPEIDFFEQWADNNTNSGLGDDYDVLAENPTGPNANLMQGVFGTRQRLDTTRTWQMVNSSVQGFATAEVLFRIIRRSDDVEMVSAVVAFETERGGL